MAPRKKSKGKKPEETMRQRQQRLLREQRARKAAKTKPVKARTSTPTSTRVEKVKVRVEGQKQLPPSKSTKALPPGQRGGAVSTGNRPRRTNINSNSNGTSARTGRPAPTQALPQGRSGVSARRAQAAARAERARQGTTSRGTRTGQPAGAANRRYGARRVDAAVKRAEATVNKPRRGGLITPLTVGATIGNWMQQNLPRTATPSGRGSGRATDRVRPGPPGKNTPKPRGMSNIPPSEGPRNNPNYGKPGTPSKSKPKPTPKPKPTSAPTYTPPKGKTTAPKPKAKKSKAHTYKEHGSDLHIGRYKTLKEHRAAVAKNKGTNKPKPASASNAQDLRSGPKPPKKKRKAATAANANDRFRR